MLLMVSGSIHLYSLDVLIQDRRWMADDHPLSVAVPFAAEQREGVVPASQTCKQILLSSATTEG